MMLSVSSQSGTKIEIRKAMAEYTHVSWTSDLAMFWASTTMNINEAPMSRGLLLGGGLC